MPKTRCESSMFSGGDVGHSLRKRLPLSIFAKKKKEKTKTPRNYKVIKHFFEAYVFIYLKQYLKTTLDVIFFMFARLAALDCKKH